MIVAVVYHPHWKGTENDLMREHLFQTLQVVESRFPNCAIIVVGNFSRLHTKSIDRHFQLKQMVNIPTRKDATLDYILTNLHHFYDSPQGFPPPGLPDHNTVTIEAKVREQSRQQHRFVFKRDRRKREKELSLVDACVQLIGQSNCLLPSRVKRCLKYLIKYCKLDLIF